MNNETKICCICGKEYTGFGNNAWPADGHREFSKEP